MEGIIMNTQLINLSEVWSNIKSIFSVPHSEQEYENLVQYLDVLIDEVGNDENHEFASVMETVGRLIENYEDQNYKINKGSIINTLKYLMKEHDLKQSDMKEIGSQGVVSEILSGKRSLNIDQIKKISEKFHVSPTVFI
jgi:HTH-type transcriptional regulator/antitoxin HigA